MKLLGWFKVFGAILCLSISLSLKANAEVQIRNIMQQQQDAWNSGNLKAFMQGYWQSEKLQFIGKSGIKTGWQTTLDNYKNSYPNQAAMGKLTFDILQVEVNGDSAFVLGKWSLQRASDNPHGFYTLYWKRIEGQWKIIIDHSS
ncbi:YybH family protein [Aliikangiella sp. IMCC44632]